MYDLIFRFGWLIHGDKAGDEQVKVGNRGKVVSAAVLCLQC